MALHQEGERAHVKGAKRGEIWVWHKQTYPTAEGTSKGFWTTIFK